jgi:hypothetical protein
MLKTVPAFMAGLLTFATLIASATTAANARSCAPGLYGGACIEPRRTVGVPGTPHFNPLHNNAVVAKRPAFGYHPRVN